MIKRLPSSEADGRNYAFEISGILSSGSGKSDTLILAASSEFEADDWINAISSINQQLEENNQQNNKEDHVYQSFEVSFLYVIT